MVQATLETKVSNIQFSKGPLLTAHSNVVPGTELHAHEIMALRESRSEFRNLWVWTADFSMYRVENNDAFLYFAPREHNLIFRDIENATAQLRANNNYVPPKKGIDEVVAAAAEGKVLKIKIDDLHLQKHNQSGAYGYFDVDPDNLDSLNPAQKSFVQAIYGSSRPGNIVYVLDSSYVKKQLKGKEDSAIARASALYWAGGGSGFSGFFAGVWGVDLAYGGLFGVLKEAPKAPQKLEEAT